jgi:hypothetical protein
MALLRFWGGFLSAPKTWFLSRLGLVSRLCFVRVRVISNRIMSRLGRAPRDCGRLRVFVDVDHALDGFDPVAVVGEAGLGADGSDDFVAGDGSLGAAFDDRIEREAHIVAAAGEEIEGVGVAIKGFPFNAIEGRDARRSDPVNELMVDFVALGMAADLAFTPMATEGSGGFGCLGHLTASRLYVIENTDAVITQE